jgi:DNA repair exonuclease SbcCD ATPase subunit
MFELTSLHVKNWCQHLDRAVSFARTTTAIIGSNGSGKSNLLNALCFGLIGKLDSTASVNIAYGETVATVTVEFMYEGREGVVTRTITADDRSTAVLNYNGEVTKRIAVVNQLMTDMLGLASTGQQSAEHMYVSQDDLMALLFQPPTTRLKALTALMPELQKLEEARKFAHKELQRPELTQLGIADDVTTAAVENQRSHLLGYSHDLQLAKCESEELNALLPKANATIAEYERLARLARERENVAAELDACNKAVASQGLEVTVTETQLSKLTPLLQTLTAAKPAAIKYQRTYELNAQTLSARKVREQALAKNKALLIGLNEQAAAAATELQTHLASLEGVTRLRIEAEAELKQINKLLVLRGTGGADVECPTCTQTIPSGRFEAFGATAGKLTTTIASWKATETTLNERIKQSRRLISDRDTLVALVANAERELAALPAVDPATVDAEALKTCVQTIEQADKLQTEVSRLATKLSGLQTNLAQSQGRLAALQARLGSADATGCVSDTEYARAKDILARQADSARQLQHALVTFTQAETELKGLVERLERMDKARAHNRKVQAITDQLTAIKDCFHPAGLPKLYLRKKLDLLTAKTNEFLLPFEAPFSIEFDEDMNITFTKRNGYFSSDLRRLSGGERCTLSVAFRLAIASLFSKRCNLLILDEPTAWMDPDAVQGMAGLIGKVATEITSQRGLQVIVVTHAAALVPSFESVVAI